MDHHTGKPPPSSTSPSASGPPLAPSDDTPIGEGEEPPIARSVGPPGAVVLCHGDHEQHYDGKGAEEKEVQVEVLETDAGRGGMMGKLLYGHLNQKERLASASSPEVGKGATNVDPSLRPSAPPVRPIKRAPTAPNPSSFHPAPGSIATSGVPFFLHDVEKRGEGAATPRRPLGEVLLRPSKKLASDADLTWRRAGWNIMTASWFNVLLVFVPFTHQSDTIIFVFAMLAIIPLASLLGFATEQLALRVGDSLGGLLNATFGNAVELLIAILALVKGELDIVQASMIGSILSNTLLVLGMCLFAGGLRFHEQWYAMRAAQLNISLLGMIVVAIGIPAAFHISNGKAWTEAPEGDELKRMLMISRGIAVMLLFLYIVYLVFQLYTHAYLYKTVTPFQRRRIEAAMPHAASPPGSHVFRMPNWVPSHFGSSSSGSEMDRGSIRSRRTIDDVEDERGEREERNPQDSDVPDVVERVEKEEEEIEIPQLTSIQAFVALAIVVAITGVTAEFLIGSIGGLTEQGNVSRTFVALILLPLVGNAAEHVTAVTVSVKDKIDLSLTIAVGSSLQIALFVIPFLVLIAWMIGQPLLMLFTVWETMTLVLCVLLVNWVLADGVSNWAEGAILMISYTIIALASWFMV